MQLFHKNIVIFLLIMVTQKSSDIENLINKVKKKVYEITGENLELEIKIIGE